MSRPRAGAVGAIAAFVVLVMATPAGAHGTSGPPASNYRTVITGLRPAQQHVRASLGPDRESIELRVSGPAHVTVFGYQDEPYLRIDARGVFENRGSPAVALNSSRTPPTNAEPAPVRPVRWVKISDQPVARWHDHRVHWMGGATPAKVRAAPDRSHLVGTWEIPLRVDGRDATITGTIQWSPPPAAWAWWLVALVLVGAVAVGGRSKAGRVVLTVAVATMAGSEALHTWAAWPFSLGSTVGRIGESLPSIGATIACLGALLWIARKGAWSAAPALLLAGVFVFIAGGLADLATLSHAYAPSRLHPDVARLLVTLALGLGLGTAIVGATRLRASRPPT